MKTVKRFLTLILITCFSVQVWGAEETVTFTSKKWAPWTSVTDGSNFENSGDKRGVANNGVKGKCTSTGSYSGVSSIDVIASANGSGGKFAVSIGSQQIAVKTVNNGNKNVKFTFNSSDYADIADLSGKITISVTNYPNSSKTLWIKSITITTSGGGGGEPGDHKITYDKNGGAGGATDPTFGQGDVTLANNGFDAPSGQAFSTWNTKADGTGESHAPGSTFNLTQDTTLYAIWVQSGVEVVEWNPSYINIVIEGDENGAQVVLENKNDNSTTTEEFADKLFISKYFEADGDNKMIAIYNGTKETIDITNMWLSRSQKGSPKQDICLKKFGKIPGQIAPKEEIIIMRFTSESDAAITCAEKEENYADWNIIHSGETDGEGNNIYGWLQFSGPQSIGLFDNNTHKFIDVIGATTNNNGTGELVQIKSSNSSPCAAAINTNKDNQDGAGFNAPGKDMEGNSCTLSTNRCLLIRKNTVKSGDNAIAQNVYTPQEECNAGITEAFKTLSSEWVGYVIGKDASKTCEGIAYVGGFDYSKYYTQYTQVGDTTKLDGHKNSDGTFNIPYDQLDTLSCTLLKIKLCDATGKEVTTREYRVPIMVDKNTDTKDAELFHTYARATNSEDVCEKCDVVILKGKTLTKAADGSTDDINTVQNLTIYPGGQLVLPKGDGVNNYNYTVNSIQFRVEGDSTLPSASLQGNLITQTQKVIVSRRMTNKRYYFFSLPYACMVNDIRWSDGTIPVLDTDYRILKYNGAGRASSGNLKSWTPVSDGDILQPGEGYNIAISTDQDGIIKELIFPMMINQTNLSLEEENKGDATVAVSQHTGSTTIENWNWNLIAHPYVSKFGSYTGDPNFVNIKAGKLVWNGYDDWEYADNMNVYVTIPDYKQTTPIKAGDYDQILASNLASMDPFIAVFVQAAGDGDVTFAQGSRKNSAPARHLAAKSEYEDESIFIGVTLSGNGDKDQTNLRIRPDFTEEYQLGYDLVKYGTKSDSRPIIYMARNANNLAFQAVSDENAAKSLPMGVYVRNAGTYTFALSEDYPLDHIEAVYLYDAESGLTTNLLNDSYSFTASAETETKSRFFLSAIVRRPIQSTATGCEQIDIDSPMTRKVLIDGHVYIQRDGKVFDITGKQMLNY